MNVEEAYNLWAHQYDTNENKTRDLEAQAIRELLTPITFDNCLEIGCGTGKNTTWLAQKASHVIGIDLSKEMLAQAKKKVQLQNVSFIQADITADWNFISGLFDLVTCSLILEHIEDLNSVLQKASSALKEGGYMYIGELHPFKQYNGSKARFDTQEGTAVVTCFTHHVSDFILAGKNAGLNVTGVEEFFDDGDRTGIPRIIAFLFQKK